MSLMNSDNIDLKLAIQTGLMLLATVFNKAVPILFLPILTSYLTPEGFGYLAYILALAGLASIFIGLNTHTFLIVKWSTLSQVERQEYVSLTVKLSVFMTPIVTVFLLFWFMSFSSVQLSSEFAILIAFLSLMRAILLSFDAILQSEKSIGLLAGFNFFQIILHYGLAWLLLEFFVPSWEGKILGEMVALLTCTLIALALFRIENFIFFKSTKTHLIALRNYCSPLLVHLSAFWVLGSIDRIMLSELKGLEIAGIYSVAYTVGMSLDLIHQALAKLWVPWFYRLLNQGDAASKRQVVEFSYSYIVFSFLLLAMFLVLIPFFYDLLIDERYHGGKTITYLVAVGYSFELLRKVFIGHLFHLNRTVLIAIITLCAAALNAILNFTFIPAYGASAAAWTTVLSYALASIVTTALAIRLQDIRWQTYPNLIFGLVRPLSKNNF